MSFLLVIIAVRRPIQQDNANKNDLEMYYALELPI